ncbi:AMP-binding protein [Halobacterium salinarum]|nr:AMP-binding protein [Halobacterium salinarum]
MLDWETTYDQVLDDSNPPFYEWFPGGGLNASANCLDRHLDERGDEAAIEWVGEPADEANRTYTYAQLHREVNEFAAGLREMGVGEDDIVTLYMPMVPELPIAMLACARLGAPHSVVFAGFSADALSTRMNAADSEYLVTCDGYYRRGDPLDHYAKTLDGLAGVSHAVSDVVVVDRLGANGDGFDHDRPAAHHDYDAVVAAHDGASVSPVERDATDMLFLMYTSGTTGQPKGVQLTHHNLASNAEQSMDIVPDGLQPADRKIGVLPLFHIYGMTVGMNAALFAGATFYPMPRWDTEDAMSLVADAELTLFDGVPTMYNDIITHPNAEEFDLSSVRRCTVGGSGIPTEVLRKFEELYTAKIDEGYGLTETSSVTHFNSPNWGRRVGSIGKPLAGIDARIVTDDFESVPPVDEGPVDESDHDMDDITGELVVSGPNVMAGYLGLPEANRKAFTEADGKRWFHTGDLGYHDADGYFYIVDRKTHMINTAGYNVYPREVEELLFEHDAIADAAVVGVPDERRGETVKAYVVRAPDTDVSADEIREFCLTNLAEYKHPRTVEFVEQLPRTTTGKIKKHELVPDED